MDNTRDSRNIVFQPRDETEDALCHMEEIAKEYGSATFSDLCDLVGLGGVYEDTHYYWTLNMINEAKVFRVRCGYVIDLMKPLMEPSFKPLSV